MVEAKVYSYEQLIGYDKKKTLLFCLPNPLQSSDSKKWVLGPLLDLKTTWRWLFGSSTAAVQYMVNRSILVWLETFL